MKTKDMSGQRREMVEHQIVARGVRDYRVLNAMREVPREAFIPEKIREFAYDDTPLPIAAGQTISQPNIVAFMVEALRLQGGEVFTVERIEKLAEHALETLRSLNYLNVHVLYGDGTKGWPEHATFDAIRMERKSFLRFLPFQ